MHCRARFRPPRPTSCPPQFSHRAQGATEAAGLLARRDLPRSRALRDQAALRPPPNRQVLPGAAWAATNVVEHKRRSTKGAGC